LNAAAGQTVNLVEGGHSLPLSIYDMVAPVGKKLEQGGKAMATRIRRAVVAVALALLMATALAGAAWAATQVGTNGPDTLKGTKRSDIVYGLNGKDSLFGKPGGDELYAGKGIDFVFGNRGADYIVGGTGYDGLYGDRGNDLIVANDGRLDDIYCGSGDADRASVDEEDAVSNCEFVNGEPVETSADN
jgi:Ca2+-binding RTX toxin-like protein